MSGPVAADASRALQSALFEAMLLVPVNEAGAVVPPPGPAPGGEYVRLLAAPPGEALQRCMGGAEPVEAVSRGA